ncbi:metal ABC transporter ATP-binding protein [Sulfuriroseicoccus oceanibius]|uniref:Metal ABC transporter ATP-binding protein n=1 Tax=Sulfuriroseicoccus oceanibius TaxID=2707525 RepID=A0A6B3L5H5_9BACT|nr:metal ABC transporter ATP-binding protein [Sulfuriroseicoccus oceanibius]QQL45019.1 metal ABC transporter ATP-binding protein [Sulfuriroseicoccus oceanibius]
MSHETHDNCAHCGHHHELVVNGLCVNYREHRALSDVSLASSCGNCVALVGPNGAGKSTLLKTIAGLMTPASGEVLWRGAQVAKWSREIAYLPQREQIDWSFPITVRGVVEMGRYPQTGWWRSFRKDDDRMVAEAIEQMHLEDLADRQISELSGGQQQRAFIARALAQQAHVLLLDEPFTGLDRPAAEGLIEVLKRLAGEGRLVVASHHELATVPDIFDEVLIVAREQVAFGQVSETFTWDNIRKAYGGQLRLTPDLEAAFNEAAKHHPAGVANGATL